jgi:hypothetical protein
MCALCVMVLFVASFSANSIASAQMRKARVNPPPYQPPQESRLLSGAMGRQTPRGWCDATAVESPDLSGTYSGLLTFRKKNLEKQQATLTIQGNRFELKAGDNIIEKGTVAATTSCNYTALAFKADNATEGTSLRALFRDSGKGGGGDLPGTKRLFKIETVYEMNGTPAGDTIKFVACPQKYPDCLDAPGCECPKPK